MELPKLPEPASPTEGAELPTKTTPLLPEEWTDSPKLVDGSQKPIYTYRAPSRK